MDTSDNNNINVPCDAPFNNNNSIEQKAEQWSVLAHRRTNHHYNNYPYEFHLSMVVGFAEKYLDLIPESFRPTIIAACWAHDTIEDTRHTYNDVKEALGVDVAEIVYALTNEKGRNRKERANRKYYQGIKDTPGAIFVKLCDRLANVKYSVETNSSMANKYRKEQLNFLSELYTNQYNPMFEELQSLLINDKNDERSVASKAK